MIEFLFYLSSKFSPNPQSQVLWVGFGCVSLKMSFSVLVTNISLTRNFATPARGFCLLRFAPKQKHRSAPQTLKSPSSRRFFNTFVRRVGFEPTKPEGDRFTVCCDRPLHHRRRLALVENNIKKLLVKGNVWK